MSSDPDDRVDDAASVPLVPSGWQLERAISAWQKLSAELGEDEELIVDEAVIAMTFREAGVDDARDLLAMLIDATVWADRRADEAKAIADEFTARRKRYEARVERFRQLIEQFMAAMPTRKHAGRFARASIAAAPPSLLVLDEGKIPDNYFKVERTLRRSDVLSDLKQGVVIDGAQVSNGGETLRIARLK